MGDTSDGQGKDGTDVPDFQPIVNRESSVRVIEPAGLIGTARFHVWGWVEPRANFGLPDGETVVHPSDDQWVTMHWPIEGGGTRWGTLSRYRSDEEAIHEALELASGARGTLQDNNLILEVDALSANAAANIAVAAAERFLAHVAVSTGVRFTFELGGMRLANGPSIKVIRPNRNYKAVLYGLQQLRECVRADQRYARLEDARLDRSLTYFTHAKFLMEEAQQLPKTDADFFLIPSSVFMNLWKAVTVIVGEPGERDYQSRYRKLGLDPGFFKSKLEWMKGIRDSRDVAHHDLSGAGAEAVLESLTQGVEIARQVIMAYRDFLADGGSL